MKVYIKIYLVKDSFGNKYSATCEDSSDTIQICGMKNKNNEDCYFESDAYHLYSWCEDNDIEFKEIDKELDFDVLWNS